jgi:AMMECR1 domain-containing protein
LPEIREYDKLVKELDFLCKKAGVTEKCWCDKDSKILKFKTFKVEVNNERNKNTYY